MNPQKLRKTVFALAALCVTLMQGVCLATEVPALKFVDGETGKPLSGVIRTTIWSAEVYGPKIGRFGAIGFGFERQSAFWYEESDEQGQMPARTMVGVEPSLGLLFSRDLKLDVDRYYKEDYYPIAYDFAKGVVTMIPDLRHPLRRACEIGRIHRGVIFEQSQAVKARHRRLDEKRLNFISESWRDLEESEAQKLAPPSLSVQCNLSTSVIRSPGGTEYFSLTPQLRAPAQQN